MSHNAGNEVGQTTGIITYPKKPAFFAYLAADITNVTGNGTKYTVIFDTEEYDIGSNFNTSTGVFTAPVTGKYMFAYAVTIIDSSGATRIDTFLETTSQSYRCNFQGIANVLSSNAYQGPSCAVGPVQMTASDTAVVKVTVTGIGADTADIDGNNVSDRVTWFSGYLVG